jgi:hypothetical protein
MNHDRTHVFNVFHGSCFGSLMPVVGSTVGRLHLIVENNNKEEDQQDKKIPCARRYPSEFSFANLDFSPTIL